MAKPVTLSNGKSWPTQAAALAHFKAMLARYEDKQAIDNASDHDDLSALVERFDLAIQDGPAKAGSGIDHFERRRNVGDGFSTPGFWTIRTDGSATDISYIWAVKAVPMSDAQQFTGACRTTVQAVLLAAKKRAFELYGDALDRVPCEITGKLISFNEAHLDHAWMTFSQIVVGFRAARGWSHSIPAGCLTPPADAQIVSAFQDPAVAAAFAGYHHQIAKLRLIEKGANLSMAAGQRQPIIRRPIQL
jgi:hypothetical protein